ncbi:ribonuclease-like [Emydura macquarii macquarii]|uniref:ribonuclease-like n=1 Tax=Emydura macquarii macquarii TaxID=1129001 RepID=UPI00352BA0F8
MAPRGPRPAPLLPLALLLLAVGLAPLSHGASYQQFLTRHVDFPKTGAPNDRLYCDLLMQRRGLTRLSCTHHNTFVHAPAARLRAVCGPGGTHVRLNLYDSPEPFPVTTCRVRPGSRPGHCQYRATVGLSQVRLACVRRLPVRLEPTYLP